MSDKFKNILSNILGVIMFILAVGYYILNAITMATFFVIAGIGLALFLFKASESRKWLKKFFTKKLKG